MRRSAILALSITSLLAPACVQDVNLGLEGTDAGSDSGVEVTDGGSADSGPPITCNQAGVECTAACQEGFTPRPDLTCGSGSVCCGTEQTTCTGDSQQCSACGVPYPPRCVGTQWVCDPVSCQPCNVDSECGSNAYCDNNFAARVGACTGCPAVDTPACGGGAIVDHGYGNGCAFRECECPGGTSFVDGQGCVGPGAWLDIDPSTLSFFSLPIGSIRYAVSGLDPDARICVTLIWFLGSIDDAVAYCGEFSQPYVVMTGDTDGPCGQWDYAGNALTESADGCYDFAEFSQLRPDAEPHLDLIDMEVAVTSTVFTGGIRMSNRASLQPRPVSFVFQYGTDVVGEHLWIQDRDLDSRQSWVKLYADGALLPIGDGCDLPVCGEPEETCPGLPRTARDVIDVDRPGGEVSLTWDGYIYNTPTAATCVERQPAHPRDYVAEFCYGYLLNGTPESVIGNPTCRQVPFTYPTDRVTLTVVEGG